MFFFISNMVQHWFDSQDFTTYMSSIYLRLYNIDFMRRILLLKFHPYFLYYSHLEPLGREIMLSFPAEVYHTPDMNLIITMYITYIPESQITSKAIPANRNSFSVVV